MADGPQYRIYICGGPHCTASGREDLVRALEDELWALGLDEAVEVRVSGCQDRCDFGPNATVWPGPCHYAHLTPEALRRIVAQHLRDGAPVEEWLDNFR
ncbi:MAG TPA: (2Fe-2S) ferredoxin domain-containing protein [Roseiflexaceae bacterium]|nr:(2Fe-2S) ferredoxin domain-containing protein [Roseiflexaceae bacterium]